MHLTEIPDRDLGRNLPIGGASVEQPICVTCGVQRAGAAEVCAICADERQYVGWEGQAWTTISEMRADGCRNRIEELEPNLWGIGTEPRFAIGQRSLLVTTEHGNLLWDPMSYLDEETVARVREIGGVQAISASHPHFYGIMVEWSDAFDDAPIHLPSADRDWVQRPDGAYRFYDDEVDPLPGLRLIRCGGHFEGSAVLHWPEGAEGRGALLSGDTIQVVMDRESVSFMRSYPNLIPLDPATIRAIQRRLHPFDYDRIYGGWWGRNVASGAAEAVAASADRYIRYAGGQD